MFSGKIFLLVIEFVPSVCVYNNGGSGFSSECFSKRLQISSKYDIIPYNTYWHIRCARFQNVTQGLLTLLVSASHISHDLSQLRSNAIRRRASVTQTDSTALPRLTELSATQFRLRATPTSLSMARALRTERSPAESIQTILQSGSGSRRAIVVSLSIGISVVRVVLVSSPATFLLSTPPSEVYAENWYTHAPVDCVKRTKFDLYLMWVFDSAIKITV